MNRFANKAITKVSKFLGDTGAQTIQVRSGAVKAVIGGGVELAKAVTTGIIEPGVKDLIQIFTPPPSASTSTPVVWHDIGNHGH